MPSLESIIKNEINDTGRITFARFMELALYHPELGYYGSGRVRIGKAGDFYTNPHVGPVYGRLIAGVFLKLREAVGDGPCQFVEMGAGEGLMARDVIEGLDEYLHGDTGGIEYLIVERSPGMRARQEETLAGCKGKVAWYACVKELPPVTGVFFSNELVDAFPFHRVRRGRDSLTEVYVGLEEDRLTDTADVISTPRLARYFNRLGVSLPEGMTTEANLSALDWVRSVAGRLKRGFVITVDYGYPARDYYSPGRMDGTMMCCHSHTASEKPYDNIGSQDITAHVDFTSLALEGRDAGLVPLIFTDQTSFLTHALEWFEAGISERGVSQEELIKAGQGLKTLLHPDWLGGAFKALVQAKGMGPVGVFDGMRNRLGDLF